MDFVPFFGCRMGGKWDDSIPSIYCPVAFARVKHVDGAHLPRLMNSRYSGWKRIDSTRCQWRNPFDWNTGEGLSFVWMLNHSWWRYFGNGRRGSWSFLSVSKSVGVITIRKSSKSGRPSPPFSTSYKKRGWGMWQMMLWCPNILLTFSLSLFSLSSSSSFLSFLRFSLLLEAPFDGPEAQVTNHARRASPLRCRKGRLIFFFSFSFLLFSFYSSVFSFSSSS